MPLQVRGSSLKFANHFYPTAQSLGSDVRVVCVCGSAIQGRLLWKPSRSSTSGSLASGDDAVSKQSNSSAVSRWDSYFAYESYRANVGHGDVDGDGVTPLSIAFLPGAEHLVLKDVWHSPRRRPGQLWYGSAEVQGRWEQYLLEPEPSAEPSPPER